MDTGRPRLLDARVRYLAAVFPAGSSTRISNVPGSMGGRGRGRSAVGGGGSPNWAVAVKMRCVFGSSAMVRAPRWVWTGSSGRYLSGASSWYTASVPSPHEANTIWVAGSNAAASTPLPIGSMVTIAPDFASSTTSVSLPQLLNRSWCWRSIASPVGDSPGRIDHRALIVSVAASNATTALLSSRFTYTVPFPSWTANSGLSPSTSVPATVLVFTSIAVAEALPPLNVNTRLVVGSYRMASGLR